MRRIGLLTAIIAIGISGSASAATIEVDSATDDGTGCTLREAIDAASGDADIDGCAGSGTYGDDTITFAPAVVADGTIGLEFALVVGSDPAGTLEIQGPGADSLAVSGQHLDRVFRILSPANSDFSIEISGLTIQDGFVGEPEPSFPAGAGIFSRGLLVLDQVRVVQNSVAVTDSDPTDAEVTTGAAGIYVFNGGRLLMTRSTVSGNGSSATATSGVEAEAIVQGAGISVGAGIDGGEMSIEHSTISGNFATAFATDPTAPTAQAVGGGVFLATSGEIVGSTIAGNSVTATTDPAGSGVARGGGIITDALGFLEIESSTIAGNSAPAAANLRADGEIEFANTVLAEPAGGGTNCQGDETSQGHNLSDDDSCDTNATGDIGNTPANLRPLDMNGGPTETRPPAAPQVGSPSPLIDAGVAAEAGPEPRQGEDEDTDQRGSLRTVEYDLANGEDGDGTDIGAVEIQGATPTATTPASPNDDANPEVTGTAEPDSTVHLFRDAGCATEVGMGTPAAFASPGFTAGPLALGSTTDFRATAEYGTATSLCSPTGVSYTRPAPPDPGPGPGTTPTPPSSGSPPPPTAPKRCKKGQKLKKGKCVRKKRRP